MIVVGCNNGSPNDRTGAGYGIRVTREHRDRYFERGWPSVTIELDKENMVKVDLSDSFWRGCTELRSARIGKWMLDRGLASWPKGIPPGLKLEPIGNRQFRLSRV
ncbi:MAG: hypothetical protein KAV99_01370 [Candidatus Latescibacteria bacterium]|nr:hypothetical protein [Candidatus Latescibacterota bacterium]